MSVLGPGGITYRLGEVIGKDETAKPVITWRVYGEHDDPLDPASPVRQFAACYVGGDLLAQSSEGWCYSDTSKPERAVRRLVNDKTLARARACMPDGWPLLDSQAGVANVAQASKRAVGPRLAHQLASEIKVDRPVWLWPCWLVAGAVQLLVGRQGSGKSTFAAWVVARLSTGLPWPDDEERRAPVRCAMLSLEEPPERLTARLWAAGANLDAVEILGDVEELDEQGRLTRRRWQLPRDCTALETTIRGTGVAVVTIDGLGYAVQGDSHNYANVGSALSALAGVAERTGACILGLTHPPKGNADATTAAIGSTAWTAIARISWVMGADPTDDSGARRVVRPAPGSNYRLPDHGLSFLVGNHDETEAGFITGLRKSEVSAEAITAPPEPESPEETTKLDEARDFVRRAMADGPVRANEATAAAKAGGIAEATLRRARAKEGVVARQRGKIGAPEWWWEDARLPSDQSSAAGDFDQMGNALFDQDLCPDQNGMPPPSDHEQMGGSMVETGPFDWPEDGDQ